jgi:hypothetical protein
MRLFALMAVSLLMTSAASAATLDEDTQAAASVAAPAAPAPAASIAPATASPAAPATAAQPAKPKYAEKVICEHEEVIGSRLEGRRVCKTASQWAADRAEARAAVDHSQTNRNAEWGTGH